MSDLNDFPITRRWPAQHPDRIQLYSLNTPNGMKAGIMLEETGLPYEAHKVDLASDDQKSAAFLILNPNGTVNELNDAFNHVFATGQNPGLIGILQGFLPFLGWLVSRTLSSRGSHSMLTVILPECAAYIARASCMALPGRHASHWDAAHCGEEGVDHGGESEREGFRAEGCSRTRSAHFAHQGEHGHRYPREPAVDG